MRARPARGQSDGGRGWRQFALPVLLITAVVVAGVSGYMLIEGWGLMDALYMTVISLTTVGYREVHPLSAAGRIFTMGLIVSGVGSLFVLIGMASVVMLEGRLQNIIGRRKVRKEIAKMRNHYIVCGYGRMGRIICQEFARKNIPFVIIEKDQQVFDGIGETMPAIHGDDSREDVLKAAGIARARGLVSVVSSDAANVYITLTARELAPDIFIVARAGEEGSEKKLLRAGANKVISPYVIGGSRIAQAILRPAVVDFIELVTGSEHLDLQMEEVEIQEKSSICNVTLPESGIRRQLNVIVVAIKKAAGHMVFNPAPTTLLERGDRLIVLGGMESLARLEDIAQGRREYTAAQE